MRGTLKDSLRRRLESLLTRSLRSAVRSEGLSLVYRSISKIVPDITDQYSAHRMDTEYLLTKVRAMHAFQMSLATEAIAGSGVSKRQPVTVVDVGDSSGTHLEYIRALMKDISIRPVSVNIDMAALEKIRKKGIEAIRAAADEVRMYAEKSDIIFSFEMLEHLHDPVGFLKKLSDATRCKAFIVTVPYVRMSRVALHHIRRGEKGHVNAEGVHVFELSPADWRLIFMHSGWSVIKDTIYLQYPRRGLLSLTRFLWRRYDFEGFYGAILRRDTSWSELYDDWDPAH